MKKFVREDKVLSKFIKIRSFKGDLVMSKNKEEGDKPKKHKEFSVMDFSGFGL